MRFFMKTNKNVLKLGKVSQKTLGWDGDFMEQKSYQTLRPK